MLFDPRILIAGILAVSSWITPQPRLSQGLIVVYGNQQLVQANADWHGYDLGQVPGRCGIASISPAELGHIAWVSLDRHLWMGPCLVVDVGGRNSAMYMIYHNHEVAEITWKMAHILGFALDAWGQPHGAQGFVYFGDCPPDAWMQALPYAPPLRYDTTGEITPSFFPYYKQELAARCPGQNR